MEFALIWVQILAVTQPDSVTLIMLFAILSVMLFAILIMDLIIELI